MDDKSTVETEMMLRSAPPDPHPVQARFRYDPADPYAVSVTFHTEPDAETIIWTFARELLATPDGASTALAEPLPPGVRSLSITSATDLPLMPDGWRLPVDRNACPQRVAHPYLPLRSVFRNEVNRFLDERPALPCPVWRDWGAVVSMAFTLPPHGR
jgi:hypothetical protein